MSALPRHRVHQGPSAFANIGVDYFGPILVIMFRRSVKRYGCLFMCLVTRAVHIEIAHSLDQDSFLQAFTRFTSRRGTPSTVYSDNGTNLTAGERELNHMISAWNQSEIGSRLTCKNIRWIFSPPAAPHFGGVWERLVQSAKRALSVILNGRSVSDEVLSTAMVEVENLINSRPLTHVSVDATDPEPLTPNLFLLGHANVARPFDRQDTPELDPRRKFQHSQLLASHFWRRWMKEYVPSLTERRKWLKDRKNLQEGDVVLIADPNTARGSWPIGRIVRPLPSADNVVRKALVRTGSGEYIRPVAKLCLLETSSTTPSSASSPARENVTDQARLMASLIREDRLDAGLNS